MVFKRKIMNNKSVVYTSLFGNYDNLTEPAFKDEGCDYICFTDQNELTSKFWNVIYVNHSDNPVSMNRKYKMFPHIYLDSYDRSLYIDANIIIKRSVSELFERYLNSNPISFPKHFTRTCIYQEAAFCLKNGKIQQKEYDFIVNDLLRKNDFPENYGLAENNIIFRTHNNNLLNSTMQEWWECFQKYARRDQLSLMYVLWKNDVKFSFMQESSRNDNRFFDYQLHKRYQESFILKRVLLSISARREKNIYFKIVSKLIDKL